MKWWKWLNRAALSGAGKGICAAAVVLLLSAGAWAADTSADNAPIDWSRARELHQREQNGDKLSTDDQAYLDKAKAAMARGEGPRRSQGQGAGQGISPDDMKKARELFQKKQNGEALTEDEQKFLDKIRTMREKTGGGEGQTRGQGQPLSPEEMQKARELFQKMQNGEKLTDDGQKLVDRLRGMRQRAGGGQGTGQGLSPEDMKKARELFQKMQGGEKLTDDEQKLLDRVRSMRQRAGATTRPADGQGFGDIDPQKARALYQKSQAGEKLTADEQAYLDKARAMFQRRQQQNGRGPGGPPQGKPAITNAESTDFVPLTQLTGEQKYKGVDGGLYGGGSNVPPESQMSAAKAGAARVVRLDGSGSPASDGKAVLMSIGMSNTTMEFSVFKKAADEDSAKASSLVIVDAAQGGKDAAAWANVGATGTNPVWDEAERRLKEASVTPQQVEVVWIKQALMGPSRFGEFPGHVDELQKDVETILNLAKAKYPNLRLAYLSSRIYAGYAQTMLNPEPYAYEGAFAMRGVILNQIKGEANLNADPAKGEVKAPVVLWGPYLWANGVKGRDGDDLIYKREDVGQDGTHPSPSGRQKVAEQLLKFFKSDSTATPWFVGDGKHEAAQAPAPVVIKPAAVAWSRDDAAHLLRRAGFGGTPAQIDRLHAMGQEAAVDYLITGKLPEGATAPFEHADLPELADDLHIDYRLQGPLLFYKLSELRAWWLDRMARSDRPLEEKMSLFWHGLFCSGVREVKSVYALGEQNKLFHREAIGNYKRLTQQIIHDSAMIRYLNNDENQKGRPNENLARELMELFTMGEGNGYTEADIPEVARALTGVTVDRFSEQSMFYPERHDDGPKTIFGKTGKFTPDDVPELIFARNEPANYLARKLWIFFGTPEPSDDDIAPVAKALKESNWELAPALRALFTSPSFYSDRAKFALIKSPVEIEAMSLRLLEEPAAPRLMWAAAQSLQTLSQELFQPPNVKGWPGQERWITSATLNGRANTMMALASGRMGSGYIQGMRAFRAGRRPGIPGRPNATRASTTQPTLTRDGRVLPPTEADKRFARLQELRQEQAEQVQAELAKMPPMPPASEMVVPSKLFAELGSETTAEKLVDAAAKRFLQEPLPDEQKQSLVHALGADSIHFGDPQSDDRVRQMIGTLMGLPEYQLE
jgi:hypothetical protein